MSITHREADRIKEQATNGQRAIKNTGHVPIGVKTREIGTK